MRQHLRQDSDRRTGRPRAVREDWQAGPPDSQMRFALRHLVLSEISGLVGRWRATLRLDFDQPSRSSVDVVIDAASVDTGASDRDDHIRSAEFLDTTSFPEIRFRSTEIRPGEREGRFIVVGSLSIRDVTREVSVTVERQGAAGRPPADSKLVFTAEAELDRQDFGLHWNQDLDWGGLVVGDKVRVQIRFEARRSSEKI